MRKRLSALLLAAAMVCGMTACVGGGAGTPSPVPETGERIIDTDVVIVGAGGAGMTAGIAAARAGKRVVILEKADMAGGNSARSTGGMNAAKTDWQDDNGWIEGAGLEKALTSAAEAYPELADLASVVQKEYDAWMDTGSEGYFDSVGLFILETMVSGKNLGDLELVTTLAENSAAAIDWLEGIGIPLHAVTAFSGACVRRSHQPVNSEGKIVSVGPYLTPRLEQACIDNGVEILFHTPVTEILMDGGRAVGVKAEGCTVNAKSVILATGGFGADPDMIARQDPERKGLAFAGAPGTTGDGIRLAEAVGAATVDMDQIRVHPTVEQATSTPIADTLRKNGAILINAEGRRFCNETGSDDLVSAAVAQQPGGCAWLILDQRLANNSDVMDGYIAKGCTIRAGTWSGLARAIGVPADALSETVEAWNTAITTGEDKEFDRVISGALLDVSPYFYAIKVTPAVLHTMGGVRINSSAQVLSTDGSVIPGLFAAGEVTGGIHGGNCLDGNALTDAVVFGRIAGETAAAYTE